jgi:hypothetical protein
MLTYRMAIEADRTAIAQLWQETDWGGLTEAMWEQWYESPDRGPSTVCLAIEEETGAIVGQFVFLPTFVSVHGRILKASRAVAPIVSKGWRAPSLEAFGGTPLFGMYGYAVTELKNRGEALVYMLPDPRWALLLRRVPGERLHSFLYWSIALPLEQRLTLPPGYTSCFVDPADERIDKLWEQTSRLHDCLVVRTRDVIARRFYQGHLLGVERSGELVGLALVFLRWNQWQIADILSADLDESLRSILTVIANFADEHRRLPVPDKNKKVDETKKAGLLVTPAMEAAVSSVGFREEKYDFPLFVHRLDPSLAVEEIAPIKWYCSQND